MFISDPPNLDATIQDILSDVVADSIYDLHLQTCDTLFSYAEKSILDRSFIQKINQTFDQLPSEELGHFIHILHISFFIRSLVQGIDSSEYQKFSMAPVTDAVKKVLAVSTVSEAITALPFCLTDVLTAHPVDMDRGLIVNFKRELDFLNRQWTHKKIAYPLIENPTVKLAARAELTDIVRDIKDTLYQLIYTANYRKNKIKPESEQRNLSRAIKENEAQIITHWPKLILHVQFVLIDALIHELGIADTISSDVKAFLHGPRSTDNLLKISKESQLRTQPLLAHILNLKTQLRYVLEIWRGDMDGNPFVTGETTAMSIAYGRRHCFNGLSADDAVIRYKPQHTSFLDLEAQAAHVLDGYKQKGEPAWQRYIVGREIEDWGAIQILSGLIYYRMVEMTEAAELYLRTEDKLALLRVGFKSDADFLDASKLLEKAEMITGLQAGFWARARQLVSLRGLSLGTPHSRKGEVFHLDLLAQLFPELNTLDVTAQKNFFEEILLQAPPVFGDTFDLLNQYRIMIEIQADFTLVQSDSGSVTQDIEWSILLLKCISHILGHTGKIVLLCEDKASMDNAVLLMAKTQAGAALFERVVMMCAGSDNQKKMGPFYAHYINARFLQMAADKNIESFFGVGDSPLRSSTFSTLYSMKTFQPGSRKRYFFGENILFYLSKIMAQQITHRTSALHQTDADKQEYWQILETFGTAMFSAYQANIHKRHELHKEIQSISEIVTTYFSRPSKKYKSEGYILDQIRAIDSGRAQLILNTFDPQLAGFTEGIENFFKDLQALNINEKTRHAFFQQTTVGSSILETLAYFAHHLDDDLDPGISDLRQVRAADIEAGYVALSGQILPKSTDSNLRLSRLLWRHVSESEDAQRHQAIAMMIFGSNWMI